MTSFDTVVILAPVPPSSNSPSLTRIALVTGASGGIGRAIAIRLARDGFHVLIHFHKNATGAETTFSEIVKNGGSAEVIQFDVQDLKAVEENIEKHFVKTDTRLPFALINNAGIHKDGLLALMSDSDFKSVIDSNLTGPFYLMRTCLKKMLRERQGVVVNVSSLAGQTGNAGQANYAASKAGLIAMTKSLAVEVGPRNIRVNAIAPGLIETEMIQGIPQLEDFKNRIPLKRFGRPEEVAGAVSFLCSNDSTYITGATLSINGGLFPA